MQCLVIFLSKFPLIKSTALQTRRVFKIGLIFLFFRTKLIRLRNVVFSVINGIVGCFDCQNLMYYDTKQSFIPLILSYVSIIFFYMEQKKKVLYCCLSAPRNFFLLKKEKDQRARDFFYFQQKKNMLFTYFISFF